MRKLLILISAILIICSVNLRAETEKECFEKVSRGIFKFNKGFDNLILKPIAKGYNKLPEPIKKGTGNFTSNIATLLSIPNYLLQGELESAGDATGSFLINTTVGILGLGNPAASLGFEAQKEDLGQTLGTYGVGGGCYFVMPILGPTTVRDSMGTIASILGGDPWYNLTVKNDTQYFKDSDYYISKGSDGINFRSKNLEAFDNLEQNSMDFYASVRSLYLQDRKQKILNSNKIINTQDDSDWDDLQSN